jgi:thiol-disulfide isomerase/thioredoxin
MNNGNPPPEKSPDAPDRNESNWAFRMPMLVKVGLLLLLVGLASVGYLKSSLWHKEDSSKSNLYDPDSGLSDSDARQPFPDVSLTDADGKSQKLSDFKGKVVILSFWASWCTPCLVELPTFAGLEKKYASQGLKVLTVNEDDGDEGKPFARDFWSKNKFVFPSFFDTTKALANQFKIDAIPSNFVIDRAGKLAFSSFGATDWMSPETGDMIEDLLAED